MLAGLRRIDVVVIGHYHADHVGGVAQLLAKIPVGTFVDHGPNREKAPEPETIYPIYEKAIAGVSHRIVKPGDLIQVRGIDVKVVSSDGALIESPLPGAGQKNPHCASTSAKEADPGENARSVGIVVSLGKFRLVDLDDLTWNKEIELMCPANKLGTADVFLVSHHGADSSNSGALVHALAPRAAVMDNGPIQGGSPAAWALVEAAPGLQDLWQLHYVKSGLKLSNVPDQFIANLAGPDDGHYLKLTAQPDGSFTIINSRNRFSKHYSAVSNK